MTNGPGDGEGAGMSPEAAFGVLGDKTRMDILQVLGDADEPLSFSELRTRVGTRDSGQFNYHLQKLVGHFVAQTDDGYELRRSGERVVEAVLSGTVTETPVIEPTQIDQTCAYCGGPVGVEYDEERVTMFCTKCSGVYGTRDTDGYGHLGVLYLPPAGVQGRTPLEVVEAAHIWGGMDTKTAVSGVCPRCSAAIDERVAVCDDHDDGGVCEACGGRYAATIHLRCTNCIYERTGAFGVRLLTDLDLLRFLTTHGINPFAPSSIPEWTDALANYDEEVLSVDPFEARYTYTIDEDSITLTVGEDLSVVDATDGSASETPR